MYGTRHRTCPDRSGDLWLDVDGASTAVVHELLRGLVQCLGIGIKNLDPVMLVDQRKAFRLPAVVLDSEHHPESILYRNFDEVVNKTVNAIYIDLYR